MSDDRACARRGRPSVARRVVGAALATLPADWSDLLGEIQLELVGLFERAALLSRRINPRRDGVRVALRFRCARGGLRRLAGDGRAAASSAATESDRSVGERAARALRHASRR